MTDLNTTIRELVRDEVRRVLAERADGVPSAPLREDYLTTKQAAKLLALSAVTLEQMRQQGRGPEYVKAGRRVLYPRTALDAWLTRKESP